MSAHTPGPWSVVDDAGKGVVSLADVHANDVVVAILPKVNHANAALIAAAPNLLAALESVLPYAAAFWRSGETPAACLAEARALVATLRGG